MKKTSLAAAVCIIVLLSTTSCGSKAKSFENQVKTGNYSKAIEIYNDSISGNSNSEYEASSFLENLLDEKWTEYVEGNITDEDFMLIYTTVQKINDEVSVLPNLEHRYLNYLNMKASKENYSKGLASAQNGDYADAIVSLSAVLSEDQGNYSAAQDKLAEVVDTYIAEAEQLAESGSFDEAISCIQDVMNYVDDTSSLEDALTDLNTKKVEKAIREAYNQKDYITVFHENAAACDNEYVVISSEMADMYTASTTAYLDDLTKKAEKALGDQKDYASAIEILQSAIAEVDGDDNLIAEIEEKIANYQEYIPVALTSLEYTQKTDYIAVGAEHSLGEEAKDVNGNQYDEQTVIYPSEISCTLASWYRGTTEDNAYVLYNLNHEYSSLSGTVYRPYESLSSLNEWEKNTTVKIYGDDVLLYEAPNITKSTYDPIKFEIDVSGVRDLKIVMMGVWTVDSVDFGMIDIFPKVCMGEVYLQK